MGAASSCCESCCKFAGACPRRDARRMTFVPQSARESRSHTSRSSWRTSGRRWRTCCSSWRVSMPPRRGRGRQSAEPPARRRPDNDQLLLGLPAHGVDHTLLFRQRRPPTERCARVCRDYREGGPPRRPGYARPHPLPPQQPRHRGPARGKRSSRQPRCEQCVERLVFAVVGAKAAAQPRTSSLSSSLAVWSLSSGRCSARTSRFSVTPSAASRTLRRTVRTFRSSRGLGADVAQTTTRRRSPSQVPSSRSPGSLVRRTCAFSEMLPAPS
jgi:hypothetical protein